MIYFLLISTILSSEQVQNTDENSLRFPVTPNNSLNPSVDEKLINSEDISTTKKFPESVDYTNTEVFPPGNSNIKDDSTEESELARKIKTIMNLNKCREAIRNQELAEESKKEVEDTSVKNEEDEEDEEEDEKEDEKEKEKECQDLNTKEKGNKLFRFIKDKKNIKKDPGVSFYSTLADTSVVNSEEQPDTPSVKIEEIPSKNLFDFSNEEKTNKTKKLLFFWKKKEDK